MSDYGLTPEGFKRKPFSVIHSETEERLRLRFGEDVRVGSENVFGQLVGIHADDVDDLWAELEAVHLSFDPAYNEGTSQDATAALSGVTRLKSTATTVDCVFYGTEGTVVPAEAEARSEVSGDVYCTDAAVTITRTAAARAEITIGDVVENNEYIITIDGTEFSVTAQNGDTKQEMAIAFANILSVSSLFDTVTEEMVIKLHQVNEALTPFNLQINENMVIEKIGTFGSMTAKEKGAKSLPAGDLTEMQSSVAGWDAVVNVTDGIIGRDTESDDELRLRRAESVSLPATAMADSIRAQLLQTDDVQAAKVYENEENEPDVNGIPPHGIWCVVQGGADGDIGLVIYQKKAGGIRTRGNEEVQFQTTSGQIVTTRFDRPDSNPVYIDITIEQEEGYSDAVPALIKESLVAWGQANLSIADSLLYSRLYTPINSIAGFEVLSMTIGREAEPTETVTLDAAINEIFTISSDNINITVV